MIISDNETKIDMLNNKAIARTVADIIRDCDDRPISIGIHGDWGAGKSSILAMVEDELSSEDRKEDRIVCIRFNGWQHQGFEDAKIALMSAIVSELSSNITITEEAKDILQKLWKNINWFSVVKTAGSAAFSLATGLPPIGLLNSLMDKLKSTVKDEKKINDSLESIKNYMTDAKVFEDVSLNKEFSEFQNSFEELLKKSKIDKLVILIDDLDRCLPKVTIETLEAARLFMFTKYTAFVIAADEAMIEYAVHSHFPNLLTEKQDDDNSDDYSKRYLEKLIQVPFKIPALGKVESEMYITLLMISSQIKDDNKEFNKLLSVTIEKMKKPWENSGFSEEELRNTLETSYPSLIEKISVANQISDILSGNTQGNPRKIKRFINMLLLRKQMADARGFGDSIRIPILAKLMLAEYYFPNQYKEIATLTNDYGQCPLLIEFEKQLSTTDSLSKIEESERGAIAVSTPRDRQMQGTSPKDQHIEQWEKNKSFSKWVASAPTLENIDLRPYFFACKEREDFFFEQIKSEQLRELVYVLMSGKMAIAGKNAEIKNLSNDEAQLVFDQLKTKVKKSSDISMQPKGIDGIRVLVEHHNELENSLLSFIESFQAQTVGAWICAGWDKSIITDEGKVKLHNYFEKLKTEGTPVTKKAAENCIKMR